MKYWPDEKNDLYIVDNELAKNLNDEQNQWLKTLKAESSVPAKLYKHTPVLGYIK
jgi:hypothetical protein